MAGACHTEGFEDLLGVHGAACQVEQAWTWATVRLTPQRDPISPQWSTKRSAIGFSSMGRMVRRQLFLSIQK